LATTHEHKSIAQVLEDKIWKVFLSCLAGNNTSEDIKGDRKGSYIPKSACCKRKFKENVDAARRQLCDEKIIII